MHEIDTYVFSTYKVQNVEIKQHVKLLSGAFKNGFNQNVFKVNTLAKR